MTLLAAPGALVAGTHPGPRRIAAFPEIVELNIGHFLIGEAVFTGLAQAVRDMRKAMTEGRKAAV